jgi:hypothetical protein
VGTGTTLPSVVTTRSVSQNSDGTWGEVSSDEENRFSSPNDLYNGTLDSRNQAVRDYETIIYPLDEEFYNINTEINAKKSQIVSLVSTAIGAGCSFYRDGSAGAIGGTFTSSPGIGGQIFTFSGGVACGIGSTIYNDTVKVTYYPNLIPSAPSGSSIFRRATDNLTPSLFTRGFENSYSNNNGAVVGDYSRIPTNPDEHIGSLFFPLSPSQRSICAGYGSSIVELAYEILDLRTRRNSFLSEINALKEDKTSEEIVSWGSNRTQFNVQSAQERIDRQINTLRTYVDDIVLENLVIYLDATTNYGVSYTVQNTTGLGIVTSFPNLGGDGSFAIPINSPTYVSQSDGVSSLSGEITSPSIRLNGTNQYFAFNKSYINDTSAITTGDISYSIEAWIKITDDSILSTSPMSGGAGILGIGSIHGIGLQVYKPSGGITVNFGSRSTGSLDSATTLSLNTWYHIVGVREQGVNSRIYINSGISTTSTTAGLNVISTASPMQIGYAGTHISQYFKGEIGIIRLYKSALTDAQVLQNFNANKVGFGYS